MPEGMRAHVKRSTAENGLRHKSPISRVKPRCPSFCLILGS